jgi:hypothetical protein
LAWRKLVDSDRLRGGILGAGHAEARERQHQRQRNMNGPDRRVCVRTDRTLPWNENWVKTKRPVASKGHRVPVQAVRRESCKTRLTARLAARRRFELLDPAFQ